MKKPESEPRKKGCMNAKDAQDLCGLLAGAVSSNTIGAEFKTFSTELEALAQEDAKRHRQETLDKALETLLLTAQKNDGLDEESVNAFLDTVRTCKDLQFSAWSAEAVSCCHCNVVLSRRHVVFWFGLSML